MTQPSPAILRPLTRLPAVFRRLRLRVLLPCAVLLATATSTAWAQTQPDLGSQTLGRSYLFVFLAYAIAWVLVMGWVVSIARRLARVERELRE